MTAADSGSKSPKSKSNAVELTSFYTAVEIAKLKIMNRCRKRPAVGELPLPQIFDDVCRTVDVGGNDPRYVYCYFYLASVVLFFDE